MSSTHRDSAETGQTVSKDMQENWRGTGNRFSGLECHRLNRPLGISSTGAEEMPRETAMGYLGAGGGTTSCSFGLVRMALNSSSL